MHNEFYASGFIVHPSSQQILLQQYPSKTATTPLWSLFGGKNKGKEAPIQTFHRVITERLDLPIKIERCFVVYDYFHKEKQVQHYIHYAEVDKLFNVEDIETEGTVGWFTFKQISKLPLKPQTKQDITVGQRVINLATRNLLGDTPETTLLIKNR